MEKKAKRKDNVVKMSDRVAAGTVLVKSDTSLPDSTRLRSSGVVGWPALCGMDSTELEGQIRGHGWHFFYIVPAIVERSIALSRHTAIAKSISGTMRRVDEQGLNAVEIISLDVRRLFGVHVVRLVVQPRHIRIDPYIADLKPHRWTDWKPEAGDPPMSSTESAFSQAA